MKKRYYFMNLLRALSMIAIVFYHMVFTLYLYGIRQHESISFFFSNANMHIAKVGVSLFFILSGCGLMMSSDIDSFSIKQFYKKRFIKILIPFYVVYVFTFAFHIIAGHLTLPHPFLERHLKPYSFLFTVFGMDAYIDTFKIPTCSLGIGEWFLGCLVLMYALFPILRYIMLKRPKMTMLVATVYYALIISRYYNFKVISTVPMFTNFPIKIYDFILGMFLAIILEKLPKWTALIGLAVNIFFAVFPKELPGIDSYQIVIQSTAAFFAFFGLEHFLEKREKFNAVVSKFCAYSYEYFLIHHIVITYMHENGINTEFSNLDILLLFLAEIALTIALAFCLKFITSRIEKLISRKQ
ncbi:MAG: acyltransferase [Butyrivibrio sp.]|nr:acyltransferase [Butyrivibrio sp.]